MSHPPRDGGFTLIELLVTMSVMGIMMAIAISGWTSWTKSSQQSGTAHDIQSLLRSTQQRAVTEGRSMCVHFDAAAGNYSVYNGVSQTSAPDTCVISSTNLIQGPIPTASANVDLDTPSFTSAAGSGQTSVLFSSRGTAWPGILTVTRIGSSKEYTLEVEGLTGRVSLDG